MIGIVLRKLCYASLSFIFVCTLTFFLMKVIPGDPFHQEQMLPKEIYEALKEHYGLNKPIMMQYVDYLNHLFHFDFGPSFIHKDRNVGSIIKEGLWVSAVLGLEALIVSITAGLSFGVLAALKHCQWQDRMITVFAIIAFSTPSFVIATTLQYVLAIKIPLFPIAQWGSFSQTILPVTALAILPTAFIARLTRAKMIHELQQDYIKTARAKGLPEAVVIMRHGLRNAVIPVIGYLGPLSANILTGSFIIEKIFSIPGLGYWFVSSIANRDYTLIMGMTIFYCSILLCMILLADLICLWIDPRLRHAIEAEAKS